MKVVDRIESYQVSDGEVRLSIIIGDAQIGSSVVSLDSDEIGRGDISNLVVGSGPDIKNKALFTKSVVTDVNDASDWISITYHLEGGAQNQDYSSSDKVEAAGDSIIYRAKFNFV